MDEQILIAEDDPIQREMLRTLIRRKLSFQCMLAENGHEALAKLNSEAGSHIKLVIIDLEMPVMDGMETLSVLRQQFPDLPVIVLTGSKDINDAVQAMKAGANDFITKPYDGERMAITVKNIMKLSMLSREVSRLTSDISGKSGFDMLIGHDKGLRDHVALGRKAAASDIAVLIGGETGTGKEVFAKAIHGESTRRGKPFIAVNCGAIPSQLVESTLFGHEKGSFTGATEKTLGKFREAEGGTIFLDEVGELPLETQVKLLRVLQQKEVEPVGAAKPVAVNTRIISATNRDLEKEVQAGRFREDLYFRLNVLQIQLPALRDRKEDIPALTDHFIERFCAANNMMTTAVTTETYFKLSQNEWPGNVRQLENTIQRALVINSGPELVISDDIMNKNAISSDNKNTGISPTHYSTTHTNNAMINVLEPDGTFKTLEHLENEIYSHALEHFQDNVTKTAAALGIAKSTFYKKIRNIKH